eukprot:CAMPEP_0206164336 /NCGR_PEP_ID=MMETSP1474-20131121/15670_1 /ASSEMBLY_ACC=CAM_ASM_001110 /TAXON_ID=97495 /ORGANISM="Imantonia sp., Strain RCC918" /LENGTH=145 /DNA_ID=CAMNT_0053567149 /DNA_START=504 /DNA_END=938 /DNA_ORIENTATION=-
MGVTPAMSRAASSMSLASTTGFARSAGSAARKTRNELSNIVRTVPGVRSAGSSEYCLGIGLRVRVFNSSWLIPGLKSTNLAHAPCTAPKEPSASALDLGETLLALGETARFGDGLPPTLKAAEPAARASTVTRTSRIEGARRSSS